MTAGIDIIRFHAFGIGDVLIWFVQRTYARAGVNPTPRAFLLVLVLTRLYHRQSLNLLFPYGVSCRTATVLSLFQPHDSNVA